ncbi:MAG TPA: HDIG domain-containing protein [Candidatus Binataceae bacterium]|jgi:poly(A) polymerase|nr:HDIG domain-containing protein [Candidatus Binataceae bacterium]
MNGAKEAKALAIISRLRGEGFAAYLAGGCVRDRILGVRAKDFDIATDARPEVVQNLFHNTIAVGAKFGVVVVIIDGDPFEVATFRADAPYLDGRRPSAVHFGTLEADAERRDFTIGGMYYDPVADRLIDLVGGQCDLRAGILRAIGDPRQRFAEDRLRMLRAIRFAARLDFTIEHATLDAIRRAAPAINEVSAERIGDELVMILTEGRAARGMELLLQSGLMRPLLPEVEALIGCEQPANFHPEGDVYRHTMLAMSMLDYGCTETLAFGMLFHDIAKPPTREVRGDKTTFYGHTERGAEMATHILQRLRRSRFVQSRVAYLVHYHLRLSDALRMRPSTLKRMLAEDGFEELLSLARMDALASSSYLGFYHFCRRAMETHAPEQLRPPRLIGGDDLIEMGFTPGPAFKAILKEVEDLQLDGELHDREGAVAYVRSHFPPASSA